MKGFLICQRRWWTINWQRVNRCFCAFSLVKFSLQQMFSCFPCLIFSSTGSLRFTRSHEAALSKLFEELKPILIELKNKDERTFAQRCLKENFMASPHDIRGSRRLSVVFSFMEVKTKIVLRYSFLDSITSP